eukprot:COSAG04_NODE_4868_length_1852_cov_1.523103_2_plen_227_part_00
MPSRLHLNAAAKWGGPSAATGNLTCDEGCGPYVMVALHRAGEAQLVSEAFAAERCVLLDVDGLRLPLAWKGGRESRNRGAPWPTAAATRLGGADRGKPRAAGRSACCARSVACSTSCVACLRHVAVPSRTKAATATLPSRWSIAARWQPWAQSTTPIPGAVRCRPAQARAVTSTAPRKATGCRSLRAFRRARSGARQATRNPGILLMVILTTADAPTDSSKMVWDV